MCLNETRFSIAETQLVLLHNKPLRILYRKRFFIFQVQSENSPRSLYFFLTYRIQHMVVIFFCHGILLHHQWECNYTFPICLFLILGKQGHNYIWQWKNKCMARASQSVQRSFPGIIPDWQYSVAFFPETHIPNFSFPTCACLTPKDLPISTMGKLHLKLLLAPPLHQTHAQNQK